MTKKKESKSCQARGIDDQSGRALVLAAPPLAPAAPREAASSVREGGTTFVPSQPYAIGNVSIVADVYFVRGPKSSADGPWLGEAEKVAWLDEASGYECIIMRAASSGHLSGYVGVPPKHPLYGFEHEAIPADLDIEVHGGLTYSALCQHGPTPALGISAEARRICHVSARSARHGPVQHATDYRVQRDDAWWFGFECNHVYDIVPGQRNDRDRFLGHETGATFKDEAYVYGQVVDLAAQLRAIADGDPKPARTGPPPPPLGLDPKKAS